VGAERDLTIPIRMDRGPAKQDLAAYEADARASIDRVTAHQQSSFMKELAAHREVLATKKAAEKQSADDVQAIEDQFFLAEYRKQGERIRHEQELASERIRLAQKHAKESTFAYQANQAWNSALGSTAAHLAGLAAGAVTVQGLVGVFKEARDKAQEYANQLLDTKQNLLALAAAAGKKPDTNFAIETLTYGAKTGLGGAKASQFLEPFESRAGGVKGTNISAEEYEKYKEQAGELAAAHGLVPEQAGEIFAGVLKSEKFDTGAQAAARGNQAVGILEHGTGRIAKLGPQMQQLVALVSQNKLESSFRNASEAAALVSTMAEYNPEESAVLAQRGTSGLRDFGDKDKKAFFKKAGITPEMSAIEAFRAANKAIGGEVAKGVPVDVALEKFGFKDVREKRALETAYINRDKVFEPQAAAAATEPDVAGTQRELADYERSDVGVRARGRGLIEARTGIEGNRRAAFEAYKETARDELIKEGKLHGSGERAAQEVFSGFGVFGSAEEAMVEARAGQDLGVIGKEGFGNGGRGAIRDQWNHFTGSTAEAANRKIAGNTENPEWAKSLDALSKSIQQAAVSRAPAALPGQPPALGR
jgi:hypothetical protein